jgi:hypothetical protein
MGFDIQPAGGLGVGPAAPSRIGVKDPAAWTFYDKLCFSWINKCVAAGAGQRRRPPGARAQRSCP